MPDCVPGSRCIFSNTFSQLQVPLLMWDKNAEGRLAAKSAAALEMRQLHAVAEEMNFTPRAACSMVVNRR